MGGRRRSIVLAGAFVLAACSSGGDATPSTTTEPPATTAVTTTTEGPVTTTSQAADDPTTTAAPTTTRAPDESTTTTSTTPPDGIPPRVTFPDDPERQAVVDAVYAFSDLLFAAQADPSNEQLRAQIDDVALDPVRERFVAFLDRLVADGEAFVDGAESPSFLDVYPGVVSVADGSGLVDACAVDRTIQVAVGGNADGSDRVIDDTVVSSSHTYNVSLTPDGWKVFDFTIFGEWEGQLGCGG